LKKWTRAAVLVLTVLLIAGPAVSAAPGKKSFRIVPVPERNIFEQQRKYKMLCDYTSRRLPMEFDFEVLKGCAQVLEALKEEKAYGPFTGTFTASRGMDNLDFKPLVGLVRASDSSYHTYCIFPGKSVVLNQ
jgi:ABC-type phosphate/phosphonate transport system substrate-binding protein